MLDTKIVLDGEYFFIPTYFSWTDLTFPQAGCLGDAIAAACATPGTGGPTVCLGHDEVADFHQDILIVMKMYVKETYAPAFRVIDSEFSESIAPGAIRLSPHLRLTPEHVDFPDPVHLYVPACTGADTAWRSTSEGWEELPSDMVTFQAGYAHLQLDRFCDIFLGKKADDDLVLKTKVACYVNPEHLKARLVFSHVKCAKCSCSCDADVEDYCQDDDLLAGFVRCEPVHPVGYQKHLGTLNVCWSPEVCQAITLNFTKFPKISSQTIVQGGSFQVQIDDDIYDFSWTSEQSLPPSSVSSLTLSLDGPVTVEGKLSDSGSTTAPGTGPGSSDGETYHSPREWTGDVAECDAAQLPLGQMAAFHASADPSFGARRDPGLAKQWPTFSQVRKALRKAKYSIWPTPIQSYAWWPAYKVGVFDRVEECARGGATSVLLVGATPKRDNYITRQEIPALINSLQLAFDDGKYPFYDTQKKSQRIDFQSIGQMRMPLDQLSLHLRSMLDQERNLHAVFVSCREDDMEAAQYLQDSLGSRVKWAVRRAGEDYSNK